MSDETVDNFIAAIQDIHAEVDKIITTNKLVLHKFKETEEKYDHAIKKLLAAREAMVELMSAGKEAYKWMVAFNKLDQFKGLLSRKEKVKFRRDMTNLELSMGWKDKPAKPDTPPQ